ncbi:MAG TPA: glycosyltransferase [Candidatus Paceibacterota bacterium]|nr:glycosyltransferase [Candidatus Paceibacterota bacterium]
MKIHILYQFQEGGWGGGNQFLKALREGLRKDNLYSENPEDADVILFNSHHEASHIISLKRKFPEKIFLHRIDGPVTSIRGNDTTTDQIIFWLNRHIADGSIFQSKWSKEKNKKLGLKEKNFEITILNAPDPTIFNRIGKIPFSQGRKIKIVATSWSSNWKKGFAVYQYLDEHLDFSRYEMTFIGHSPVVFQNICHLEPLATKELAEELKKHDIFITASENDPCSNSLIEALHCGLPAVALKDGGHPEIVGKGGELFEKKEDVLQSFEKIAEKYATYQNRISFPEMEKVTKQYFLFLKEIFEKTKTGEATTKRLSWLQSKFFLAFSFFLKVKNKLRR